MIDWTDCDAIESVPGKMSGQPVIRGTRVRPGDLLINRAEGDAWLARNHGLPVETVRAVMTFYDTRKKLRAPVA